jgi:hypothetical protein
VQYIVVIHLVVEAHAVVFKWVPGAGGRRSLPLRCTLGAKLRDRLWTLRTTRRSSLARHIWSCKGRGSERLRSERHNSISVYMVPKLNGCIRMNGRPLPSLL